jgi:hypothetical protein
MKILNISNISSSNAMPIKSGTLQFLQDAHKETVAGLLTNILPNPDVNTIYIISGCVNTGVLPIHNISAGVLYYNGEIFNFDGSNFTLSGLEKAYARIETTQYITNADPVQFTDGVNRNVHNIRKIVIENTITSSGLPEFKDFVIINNWLKGDTKEVVCNSTYLNANFDASGLGRLERTGWAIMNGNNGTPNDNGKVVISYGADYTTLGATGGSKDAVVVAHTHTLGGGVRTLSGAVDFGGGAGNMGSINATDTSGVSGVDKNMQPYVVRLRIMKL